MDWSGSRLWHFLSSPDDSNRQVGGNNCSQGQFPHPLLVVQEAEWEPSCSKCGGRGGSGHPVQADLRSQDALQTQRQLQPSREGNEEVLGKTHSFNQCKLRLLCSGPDTRHMECVGESDRHGPKPLPAQRGEKKARVQ